MATARVFNSGNSQAVRLPKEFRLASKEVEIFRRGKDLVLREIAPDMGRAFTLLTELPDDFMAGGRRDSPPQRRRGL
ncbi:MAG: AbrB/MazE/SpoVT family DNA-binding domain-containing protein [Alphaproteobacteria bacterium]|nr:AbrB/MazE/SpoVT family DNA-binding domain-containing protein [Alphaproteobacteria bacterium]